MHDLTKNERDRALFEHPYIKAQIIETARIGHYKAGNSTVGETPFLGTFTDYLATLRGRPIFSPLRALFPSERTVRGLDIDFVTITAISDDKKLNLHLEICESAIPFKYGERMK